jgi:hypothetical protein
MAYLQVRANAFFVVVLHFQRELACRPFNIPRQGEGGTDIMNNGAVKTGHILRFNDGPVLSDITGFKYLFHR